MTRRASPCSGHHDVVGVMMRLPAGSAFPLAIAAAGLAFLGLFLLLPLVNVFWVSFVDPTSGDLTLANYVKVLGRAFYRQSLVNSAWIAVLATLASIAIGVPLAFCIARLAIPGKSAI